MCEGVKRRTTTKRKTCEKIPSKNSSEKAKKT